MNLRTAMPFLAVLTALTAGCSGASDGKPTSLPSITATTATTAPAPVPSAAQVQTPQGAAAFVRFYFDQLNVAFRTSDPAIVRALSSLQCGTCSTYVRSLEYGRNRGYRIAGDSFSVLNVEAAPLQSSKVVVEAFGAVPAKQEVDAKGGVIATTAPKASFHFTLILIAQPHSGWTVDDIRIDAN